MRRFGMFVFVFVSAIVGLSAETQKASGGPPVPVFVTSVGAANGFTDPNKDNQDTMKDLRDSIKGKKSLTLVDRREDAAIVLTVMNREKAQTTASVFGAARDCIVRIKFIFKDFETEMSASAQGGTVSSGGAWGKAAGKVAKQVEEWVVANRAKIGDSIK